MAETVCKGCGHHFPQKAKKGTVPCPHCGRQAHIPGAIVCPECDHLNQDVSYCVACGTALFRECPECDARMEVDQKACGQCGAVYEEAYALYYGDDDDEDEIAGRPVIDIGKICGTLAILALTVLILFACWSAIISVQERMDREAARQAEIDRLTANFGQALEDLDLRMRLVPPYDEDRKFITYAVYIRNDGDSAHSITLSYTDCPIGRSSFFSPRVCKEGQAETITLSIAAHSTAEFDYGCSLRGATIVPGVSIAGVCGLRVRVEQIDGVARGNTRWSKSHGSWDWRIGIFDKDGLIYPWFVDENWEKLDPAYFDFDDPSKVIGE